MNDALWQKRFQNGLHAVVGLGRLGKTLSNGLVTAGHRVTGEVVSADVLWFCVPESEFNGERVRAVIRDNPSAARIHTSGFLPATILGTDPGTPVASLHPAYSFPEPLSAMPSGVFWTMEGDGVLLPLLAGLVDDWQGNHAVIAADHKPAYHIVCVLLANLSMVPVSLAEQLIEDTGLPLDKLVGSLTLPLLHAVGKEGRVPAITGPAARGDRETVERQLHWLHEHCPEVATVYAALSRYILNRSSKP